MQGGCRLGLSSQAREQLCERAEELHLYAHNSKMLWLTLITGCAALQHKYGRETYGASVTRGAADLPPLLLIPPVGVGIDRQFYARFQDVWDGGDTHAMLNVDAMKDVAKALGKWPSDATHGPVLLAWATLLSLAPSAASGLTPPPEADPAKMSARAAGGG